MLRNVRVQFFKKLIPVVPDIYRKYNSSDLISKMVDRVEALQNIYLRDRLNYISDKYLAPLESIF